MAKWCAVAFVTATTPVLASSSPNLLFVVADDYGWNDVGFHGNSEIATPAIDSLAAEGVTLDNYYVLPVCTPTRAAFLSGRYPIKTGLQSSTISPAKPYGLHESYRTLADELRSLGYATHALGKWHLGFCSEGFMPHKRGFDTFRGYLNGAEHYFTHVRDPDRVAFDNFTSGYDYYWTNPETGVTEIDWSQADGPADSVDPEHGSCYSAHELASQAAQVVQQHPGDKPLFMYLAFQSVHAPLEAPQAYVDLYSWMQDPGYTPLSATRQKYAGMVAALDEAVENVTKAFKRKDETGAFWANTLMIFTSDNGGVGTGNNWPLRGRKLTLWEGGCRAVAFVHGWGLEKKGYANKQMIHVVDWLPTLVHVASGRTVDFSSGALSDIDGLDVWEALSKNMSSPREEFVYNIESEGKGTRNLAKGAVRVGCHKLIQGSPGAGTWDPKPQPRPTDSLGNSLSVSSATKRGDIDDGDAQDSGPWLFDLCADPEERTNLHGDGSVVEIQAKLEASMAKYHAQMVPSMYENFNDEYLSDPAFHNNTWTPWGCAALPPPGVAPAPTNCAWDDEDTTCAPFNLGSTGLVLSRLGASACPEGASAISDSGRCKDAATEAGSDWKDVDFEKGAQCNWCGGCSPQVFRISTAHGVHSKLVCEWNSDQSFDTSHAV